MTQALVTRQQVFDAADTLNRGGKPVTGYGTYSLCPVGSLDVRRELGLEIVDVLAQFDFTEFGHQRAGGSICTLQFQLRDLFDGCFVGHVGLAMAAPFLIEVSQDALAVGHDRGRLSIGLLSLRSKRGCLAVGPNLHLGFDDLGEPRVQIGGDVGEYRRDRCAFGRVCRVRSLKLEPFCDVLVVSSDLHKAEQEMAAQLRQEIARMQARIEQAGNDAAALQAELAAARAAVAAANDRFAADATRASTEIKALTIASEDARPRCEGTVRAGSASQRRAGRRSAAGRRISRVGHEAQGRRRRRTSS